MDKKLRIVIGEFHEETNSFNARICGFEQFRALSFLEGQALLDKYSVRFGDVLSGIVARLSEADAELIPGCGMHATSLGPVDAEAYRYFIRRMTETIRENAPVDAVVIDLHGATQGTEDDDVCGLICEKIRQEIGPDVVFTAGFDLHANITAKIAANVDLLAGYQTYPHIDQFQTGWRAASLALRKLAGEELYMARTMIPMIVPASGYTTETGSLGKLFARAREMVREGILEDFTIFQMQPWLDVDPAGSAAIAIARDPETARQASLSFADELWAVRDEMWPDLQSIDEVIDAAAADKSGKPIVLADFADSPGGGSNGDSAAVVERLLAKGCPVSAATIIKDPEAVALAEKVGVGGKAVFTFGGKFTPGLNTVTAEGKVLLLSDGPFTLRGPVAKGMPRSMGKCAVIRVNNIDILLATTPTGCGDLNAYEDFGIRISEHKLIVAKANTSFRAAYEPIASKILVANTPGPGSSDLKSLPFTHLSKTFYPFTQDGAYERICTVF